MARVKVFPVEEAGEVVLSSDGYPRLYGTLAESETLLQEVLEQDPHCFRIYKSTKGLSPGNVSFDDCAYLHIRIPKVQ